MLSCCRAELQRLSCSVLQRVLQRVLRRRPARKPTPARRAPLLRAPRPRQDHLPPGSLGDLAPDRAMSFEERRKLSAHMASIPGEKLGAVLDIVYEGEVRRRWRRRAGVLVRCWSLLGGGCAWQRRDASCAAPPMLPPLQNIDSRDGDGEVTLDMDTLGNGTLWKLKA